MSIDTTCTETRAQCQARENQSANLASLQSRGTAIAAPPAVEDAEMVYGRDGSLTAKINGRWLRGCSVPRAAALAQLRTMSVNGQCMCLLDPMHAETVGVALGRLRPEQSLITVVPSLQHAALLLRCADFSADIIAGRCWFVTGDLWAAQLKQLLLREEGLPIPSQFIRTASTDPSVVESLIGPAQQVFSEIVNERRIQLDSLIHRTRSPETQSKRLCLVAGQSFRLWADAGAALTAALKSTEHDQVVFDTDSPTNASHLAMLRRAVASDAIIAADLFRSDAGDASRVGVPWVTWVTRHRIPPYEPSNAHDGLVVTDESVAAAATNAGWPARQVAVAGWPAMSDAAPSDGKLTLIADVSSLNPPADLEHLSSHRLLWEHVAARIAKDPFCAHGRAAEVIQESIAALHLEPSSVLLPRFIEQLVAPAYAIAIARLLAKSGISFDIFGQGWESQPDLAARYRGPVTTRERFTEIATAAGAIVHAWPTTLAHPAEFVGRPILRYRGGGATSYLADARAGRLDRPRCGGNALLSDAITRLIRL